MATAVGISFSQAAKLIELAKAAGHIARVRTNFLDCSQHRGRAFLLRLVSQHEALIKPFTHRKEEVVPLAKLSFWKSGNEFDISQAVDAVEQQKEQSMSDTTAIKYVVFSAKWNGIWGGEHRKWTKSSQLARTFATESAAEECASKQRKNPMSNDAEVMRLESAHSLLNPTPKAAATTEVTASKSSDSAISAPMILDADITAILSIDRNALNKAFDDMQQAAKDLQQLEAMRAEIHERLNSAKQTIANLTASKFSANKQEKPKAKTTTSASLTKPGLLKNTVLDALKQHGAIETTAMFAICREKSPLSSNSSIQQCLYKMRSDKLIDGSNAAGWKLHN